MVVVLSFAREVDSSSSTGKDEIPSVPGEAVRTDSNEPSIYMALGDALPGVDQAVMGLSDTLQVAMAREMAQGLPTEAEPADWEELTAFRETEHGAILSSWWGRDTDWRLGILLDRVDRLEDNLTTEDMESWVDFLHNRLSL